MMFRDRTDAGQLLANHLMAYHSQPNAIILALPRGGVVVGCAVSLALHLPLDVFITKKLSLPDNPEYAIGVLNETGAIYLNLDAVKAAQLSEDEVEDMVRRGHQDIAYRQDLYRNGLHLPPLGDRTVILVDDGIATGATFLATIKAITELSPRRLVIAVPVAPRDAVDRIRPQVDELIVCTTPEPFIAVGQAYTDFTQVDNAEVLASLQRAHHGIMKQKPPVSSV